MGLICQLGDLYHLLLTALHTLLFCREMGGVSIFIRIFVLELKFVEYEQDVTQHGISFTEHR